MTFIFNDAIPAANNSPSVDQNDMLINNQSTNAILAIDHITFNADNGGTHQQLHLPSFSTSTSIINGTLTQGSVVYPAAGIANSGNAQLLFKNNIGNFYLSGIKAFAYANSAGTIISAQSSNVTSIVPGALGTYTVTLTANAVTSTDFIVLVSSQQTSLGFFTVGNYVITGIGVFRLLFANVTAPAATPANPQNFSFVVIQI